MARKARSEILYDRSYAHVFSRSIEKRKIFKQSNDFEEFRRLLLQQKKEKLFNIFHYCLMQTHFHMAVGVGFLGQKQQVTVTNKGQAVYDCHLNL